MDQFVGKTQGSAPLQFPPTLADGYFSQLPVVALASNASHEYIQMHCTRCTKSAPLQIDMLSAMAFMMRHNECPVIPPSRHRTLEPSSRENPSKISVAQRHEKQSPGQDAHQVDGEYSLDKSRLVVKQPTKSESSKLKFSCPFPRQKASCRTAHEYFAHTRDHQFKTGPRHTTRKKWIALFDVDDALVTPRGPVFCLGCNQAVEGRVAWVNHDEKCVRNKEGFGEAWAAIQTAFKCFIPQIKHRRPRSHVASPKIILDVAEGVLASSAPPPTTPVGSKNTPDILLAADRLPSAEPSAEPEVSELREILLTCDLCGRTFDQMHKLNHHKRYHNRRHPCPYSGCDMRYGTKTHLDRHINDAHSKHRGYHCTEEGCLYSRAGGKTFPRMDNWRRHMLNKHGLIPELDPMLVHVFEKPHSIAS